ncbi:MAG: YibE/F family protein [Clostridia bacterium]|nr:YibE/F family protein [Clostridia bacterium]
MKRFLAVFIVCVLIFSFGSVFATDTASTDDIQDSIESMFNSDTASDDVVYLDDYSQYLDVLNGISYQDEYREVYEQNIKDEVSEYTSIQRTKVYKAKVLEAGEVQATYVPYSYDGLVYKTSYQPLSIKILEGPYQDKVFSDFTYILTCDTYENIKLPTVNKGDTINVVITQDEEGNLTATSSSYDAPVVRWQWIFTLLIITIIVVVIYAGKKGIKSLVALALVADLILAVAAPSIMNGINIIFLVSVMILLTSLVIAVLKLGVKPEAFVAILSALIVTFIMTIVINGFDALANMCGITYEATYLMEYILPTVTSSGDIVTKVDFHAFHVAITVLILFLGTILVTCETAKIYEKNKKSKTVLKDTADDMRGYLADKILLIAGVLLVLMIPKYMLLLANKCALVEIINSEIMITDISRILFTIISVSIAVPVTALLGKFTEDDK